MFHDKKLNLKLSRFCLKSKHTNWVFSYSTCQNVRFFILFLYTGVLTNVL